MVPAILHGEKGPPRLASRRLAVRIASILRAPIVELDCLHMATNHGHIWRKNGADVMVFATSHPQRVPADRRRTVCLPAMYLVDGSEGAGVCFEMNVAMDVVQCNVI